MQNYRALKEKGLVKLENLPDEGAFRAVITSYDSLGNTSEVTEPQHISSLEEQNTALNEQIADNVALIVDAEALAPVDDTGAVIA